MKAIFSLLLGCGLLFSLPSYAGVEEKKAARVINAEIETAIAGIQTACHNEELISTLAIDDSFTAQHIRIATTNTRDFFAGMLAVCEDADYRAEMSKLTEVHFTLTENPDKTGEEIKIYGKIHLESEHIMHVALHVRYSLSNGLSSTVPDVIKELY